MNERCCARVRNSGSGYPYRHDCDKKARIIRDGKPYCKIHDPLLCKAKQKVRDAEWTLNKGSFTTPPSEILDWMVRGSRDKILAILRRYPEDEQAAAFVRDFEERAAASQEARMLARKELEAARAALAAVEADYA